MKERINKMIKRKRIIYLMILSLFFLSQNLFAQQQLTLQEAIAIALKNNYDIKLVQNDLTIAKNNVNLGAAGILPTVAGTFSTGGSKQNTIQTQASGTERITDGAKSTNLAYGVGLDWTIFDGFKMLANYDRLKALQQQGEINAKGQILNTVSAVINAYYNLAKQQQLVKAADTAIDISNLRVKIAKNKLDLGKGSKLDLLAATVDYNTDTSNYLQQINLQNNYKVALNQLLARAVTTEITTLETTIIDSGLDYATLIAQTEKLNPDLQNAILNKRIATLNLKQVRADRYPKISVNSGYEFSKSATPTGFNTQFRANGFNYGLTASINIFNGFLQNQNERNAKVNIQSADLAFDKTKQDIFAQLTTAYQTYSTYLGLVKVEKGNVEIANQNLDITLEKYRLGSIAPLELREAQRNAIDANNRFLEIEYQAKLAEITLKQISGTINLQ
jgi:outer membrane protein